MGLKDLFRREARAITSPADRESAPADPESAPADPESAADPAADAPSPAPVARLRSFPLKLAVMQRLMYDAGAVLPAFTMPPSLHPGAPVEDWFRGYQLPAGLVAAIDELRFSRTSEAIRQLDPHWVPDDQRFDPTTLDARDLDQLPALIRVIDPERMLADDVRAALVERGIAIA